MRIEMTCCCGASFAIEESIRVITSLTLTEEAERWRQAHALCPTYPRTVTTETTVAGDGDD